MKPLCKSVLKSKQQQACWIISTKSTQVMMWKEWYCKRSLHRLLLYQLPNSCTSPIGSKLQSTVSSFHHAQPTTPPNPNDCRSAKTHIQYLFEPVLSREKGWGPLIYSIYYIIGDTDTRRLVPVDVFFLLPSLHANMPEVVCKYRDSPPWFCRLIT